MAKQMVLSVVFHVFYLIMMPFSMPEKLQKGLSFPPVSPNFGRVTRPHTPPFLCPLHPKLHLCTLVPLPRIPVDHTPKPHLGYPILPFGMSHFTIWGIFSAHLLTMYSPDFRFVFFVFAAKVCMFSFLSVHYVSSEFIWLDKIYFITLPKLLLLPWQDTKNTDMT